MIKAVSVLLALLVATTAYADTIKIDGPLSPQAVNSSFVVLIDGTFTDLYAFQFDLTFDPTILSATAETEGSLLPSAGTTIFFPGTIDNTAGEITLTADTLVGALSGVSGMGTLASVTFTALKPGTSAVQIQNQILLNSSFDDTTASTTVSNGTVVVAGVSPVPEPGTFSLVFSALVVGEGYRRIWRARSQSPRQVTTGC